MLKKDSEKRNNKMFREKLYTKKGTNYHTLCLQNADYFIFWSQQINFQACIESYFESCMWVCMYKIMYNFMLCIYLTHVSYFYMHFAFYFILYNFTQRKKAASWMQLEAIYILYCSEKILLAMKYFLNTAFTELSWSYFIFMRYLASYVF